MKNNLRKAAKITQKVISDVHKGKSKTSTDFFSLEGVNNLLDSISPKSKLFSIKSIDEFVLDESMSEIIRYHRKSLNQGELLTFYFSSFKGGLELNKTYGLLDIMFNDIQHFLGSSKLTIEEAPQLDRLLEFITQICSNRVFKHNYIYFMNIMIC